MDSIELDQDTNTLRRTLTMKNNAARQISLNFMPSRQNNCTIRHRRRSSSDQTALLEEVVSAPDAGSADHQANLIVREMEQHRTLMEDDPLAEEMRKEALRDLPQGLTMKRHVRAKLSASVSLRSKRRPISFWKRTKYRISFGWKRSKDRLRDFVFSMELWYEAIRNIEGQFGSAVGSYFRLLRGLFLVNLMLALVAGGFLVVPQVLYDHTARGTQRRWGVGDFVRGTGPLADSVLFYGHYHRGIINVRGPSYSMPFAYFFTMGSLYLAVFAFLCYRTAQSYRGNVSLGAGGTGLEVAGRVLCGWDFGVAHSHAAALASAAIYNQFKELLNEQEMRENYRSTLTLVVQYLVKTVMTVIVVSAIAGVMYGVWQLLEWTTAPVITSLVLSGVFAICPVVFAIVVRLEHYSIRTALYVTLSRSWLLFVSTLSLLLYYWATSDKACWETTVGQTAYSLLLLDCLVSLFLLPLFEFLRGFLYKRYQLGPPPEFNLSYNLLTLIYNQCLLWMGLVFSPLLATVVALKMMMLFYVNSHCVSNACQPPAKIWRAGQTQTVLYMLITLSLFITLFLHGSLFLRSSSKHCGPFTSYELVYEVLTEGVLRVSQHEVLNNVLHFLVRPGVLALIAIFLGVAIYYMRWRAVAQGSMAELLRGMLVLQAKDKQFLLAAIDKVSRGEWLYSPKKSREGSDSHTWRYVQQVRRPSNADFHLQHDSRIHHVSGVMSSPAEAEETWHIEEGNSSQEEV